MYNRVFRDSNNKEWARVDKRAARRLYNAGMDIVIVSDNLQPFHPFSNGVVTNINNLDEYDREKGNCFDRLVNMYEVYNCISCETGYRAAFYKEV